MLDLAQRLGMEIKGRELPAIEGALQRHLEGVGTYLWLVDDLPGGAGAETFRQWLAPSGNGRTLITSRSGGWDGNGLGIPLEQLDDDAAFELLTKRRPPRDAAENDAAVAILRLLGNHALAVDVTAAAVPETGFAAMLALLQRPDADALALAAKMSGELPNGHEREVSATLLHSIQRLPVGALVLLQIASLLAEEPIPREYITKVLSRALLSRRFIGRVLVWLGKTKQPDPLAIPSAIKSALEAGFLKMVGDGYLAAHVLVTRIVRLYQPVSKHLGHMAVEVMSDEALDVKKYPSLLPHIMVLVSQKQDLPTSNLMRLVAAVASERRDYMIASILHVRDYFTMSKINGQESKKAKESLRKLEENLMDLANSPRRNETLVEVLPVIQHAISHLQWIGSEKDALTIQRAAYDKFLSQFGPDHPSTQEIANMLQQMRDAGPS
ncbi:MAG: hypothetical protein JHC88_24035 [Niveispirillum sp.]|nr:hypothetical protein [Niveispirillum sp.]